MVIRIATAECFTHGKIAAEIHAFSRGYPRSFDWNISSKKYRLSLIAGLFIPTLSGVQTVLGCAPLKPVATMDGIKVYNQEQDLMMAGLMAESVKKLTEADIGIGTTAGFGKGGIAIISDRNFFSFTSDYHADLRSDSFLLIQRRQESGIAKTLQTLETILKKEYSA